MNSFEIIKKIVAGDLDADLNGIFNAARERLAVVHHAEGRALFHTLKVGDRVRVIGGQKYLHGALGTVTEKRQTKVTIDLDERRGKYHTGIICPPGLLEKVQ
jgi:hypothetical protein